VCVGARRTRYATTTATPACRRTEIIKAKHTYRDFLQSRIYLVTSPASHANRTKKRNYYYDSACGRVCRDDDDDDTVVCVYSTARCGAINLKRVVHATVRTSILWRVWFLLIFHWISACARSTYSGDYYYNVRLHAETGNRIELKLHEKTCPPFTRDRSTKHA